MLILLAMRFHHLPITFLFLDMSGAIAFTGFSLALMQNSIWYKRSWATTFKFMFDGLIYALFTAGIFGGLWPSV